MLSLRYISLKRNWLVWRSSLYANSLLLMAANGAGAALGFLFWAVSARLYKPQELGLAAAALSAVNLLSMFSMLGLNYALVRFLPEATDPQDTINSSFTIGSMAALALSVTFVAGLSLWSPALLALRGHPLFVVSFVVTTVFTTVTVLLNSIFLARKRASVACIQTIMFGGMRVVSAAVLAVVAHPVGPFGAWALSLVVSTVCGIVLFLPRVEARRYSPRVTVSQRASKDMVSYALANYLSSVLWEAPMFLLPLIVVNVAGPKANAYFYVASNVSGLLAIVPTAFSLSLFVYGSHDQEKLTQHAIESIRGTLWLLLPAIGAMVLFGDKVLLIFGRAYLEQGTALLRILALSTLPMTVNFFFFSVRRVQQHLGSVIAATAWILVASLGLSAVLLPRFGLVGTGVAWFAAQASAAMVLIALHLLRRS